MQLESRRSHTHEGPRVECFERRAKPSRHVRVRDSLLRTTDGVAILIRRPRVACWNEEESLEMTREADLVRSLVNLADTLVADYDVAELLTRLADQCVHVLGASAAGVMLANASGELQLMASSSEAMRVLELFE